MNVPPIRRLLSDDELMFCRVTGRFVVLKDVVCDLAVVVRRAALVEGSPLAVVDAIAAIALEVMRAGSKGAGGMTSSILTSPSSCIATATNGRRLWRNWRNFPRFPPAPSRWAIPARPRCIRGPGIFTPDHARVFDVRKGPGR